MSDKLNLTAEELQAKLEASSRINAELIAREQEALTKLKAYEQAEAEAKAAAEKAEAEAKQEALIQAEVEKRLKELSKDTIEVLQPIPVEPATEEQKENPDEQPKEKSAKELMLEAVNLAW